MGDQQQHRDTEGDRIARQSVGSNAETGVFSMISAGFLPPSQAPMQIPTPLPS